ncbi:ATP-binding protein [Pseudobacteroides cellulosolvens]|nr:ATP-binding protein [Pseudobacteroides cellulosolvens]
MIKTLKGKINLIYLVLVLLIAVVGITASFNLYNLSKAIDGLMIANYKSISAANNMIDAIERQDSAVLIYISVDSSKGKALFADRNEEFLKWYNVTANNITEKGEKELVLAIKASYNNYVRLFFDLQEIRSREGISKAVDFYNNRMMSDFINTKNILKQLCILNEKSMFNSKYSATKNSNNSMYIVLGLSIFAIISGYTISRFFSNKFLMPVTMLTKTMRLIKAGDMNQQANIISRDEIGELAEEFNNMTKRLQQYEQSTRGNILAEENKSNVIVKNISDPIVVVDMNYRIVMLNHAFEKVFGVIEKNVINKNFIGAVRNKEIFDFISSAIDSDVDTKQKIFTVNSNKEYNFYNVVVATAKDSNDNLSRTIVVFQNVTQLKELEKIRTDFIATISHEFKTPLTSIIMGADMLNDESVGVLNEEQQQFVNAIKEDSDRLAKLVNDLLELTRIESGKAVYKFQKYSINSIIECAVQPFYNLAAQNSVYLHYEPDNSLPMVYVDFEKITWVLNNLITNAIKYTGSGDEICISAVYESNKVYVTVKDTGTGIPEDYLEKIFEKYVQVRDSDFEVRGTGLGLAVVKEIIAAHNGVIWCESKLGVGSSFKFTLEVDSFDVDEK